MTANHDVSVLVPCKFAIRSSLSFEKQKFRVNLFYFVSSAGWRCEVLMPCGYFTVFGYPQQEALVYTIFTMIWEMILIFPPLAFRS